MYSDNTEDISEKIRVVLLEKSKQFKRVLQAFPNAYTSVNKNKKGK